MISSLRTTIRATNLYVLSAITPSSSTMPSAAYSPSGSFEIAARIITSETSLIWPASSVNRSTPTFSTSSTTRRSARNVEPTIAIRSPRDTLGVRTFEVMMAKMSSTGRLSRKILIGGSRRPS